jgi:hypothetical protein
MKIHVIRCRDAFVWEHARWSTHAFRQKRDALLALALLRSRGMQVWYECWLQPHGRNALRHSRVLRIFDRRRSPFPLIGRGY